MLQSFNSRLGSVSSLRCFDAPAVFPTRRVKQRKSDRNKKRRKVRRGEPVSIFLHTSRHPLPGSLPEKPFLVSKWQMLKYQNVPCKRVSHTRSVFLCLCLRENKRLGILKLNDTTGTRTSIKKDFAFFQSLSRLFLQTYLVKCRWTLLIWIPRDHIQV